MTIPSEAISAADKCDEYLETHAGLPTKSLRDIIGLAREGWTRCAELEADNAILRAAANEEWSEFERLTALLQEARGAVWRLTGLHDDFLKAQDGFMGNQADAYYMIAKRFEEWNAAKDVRDRLLIPEPTPPDPGGDAAR